MFCHHIWRLLQLWVSNLSYMEIVYSIEVLHSRQPFQMEKALTCCCMQFSLSLFGTKMIEFGRTTRINFLYAQTEILCFSVKKNVDITALLDQHKFRQGQSSFIVDIMSNHLFFCQSVVPVRNQIAVKKVCTNPRGNILDLIFLQAKSMIYFKVCSLHGLWRSPSERD